MMKKKPRWYFSLLRIPLIVISGMMLYLTIEYVTAGSVWAVVLALAVIVVGSGQLIKESIISMFKGHFALDYIAILAIAVGVATQQYVVALVIVLMLSTGQALEEYGMTRAKESLTALVDRIPSEVVMWSEGKAHSKRPISDVKVGQKILVRKGEVVPLDGILVSEEATTDESSITGEPYVIDKVTGDVLRSGTINVGDVLVLNVTTPDSDSTYRKIITMVQKAQTEKAPLIRLADRFSAVFTLVTCVIAGAAYIATGDIQRVLAVLVVATPCPLILATPIALFGGINAAARGRILTKRISSIEVLARVTDVVFDKTGTITLGHPFVSNVVVLNPQFTQTQVHSIAEAIERNSLHPLAKAIVAAAKQKRAPRLIAQRVKEQIGSGISATIAGVEYTLAKSSGYHRSNSVILHAKDEPVARIEFEDNLKDDSGSIITELHNEGLSLHIFTGDREENAAKLIRRLGRVGSSIHVRAHCSPADKKNGVARLKKQGRVVAMVGDGINDAPALATADVGLVFSNEEQTASSEAADIIFLGGDLSDVSRIIRIAQQTIRIALQSIGVGIGLSVAAMIAAALGYIPPMAGAILQEGIDVMVILNALRASAMR